MSGLRYSHTDLMRLTGSARSNAIPNRAPATVLRTVISAPESSAGTGELSSAGELAAPTHSDRIKAIIEERRALAAKLSPGELKDMYGYESAVWGLIGPEHNDRIAQTNVSRVEPVTTEQPEQL